MNRQKPRVLQQFEEQGYVVIKGLLDAQNDLKPVMEEYALLLDRLARQWYDEGKLASAYEDLPFGRQLSQVLGEAAAEPSSYQHLEISLPQTDVTETTPIHLGPRGLQSPQKSQTSGRCRVIRRTRDLFESRTARTHQTARENAARGPEQHQPSRSHGLASGPGYCGRGGRCIEYPHCLDSNDGGHGG